MRLGPKPASSHHLSVIARTDLPIRAPYRFGRALRPVDLSPCVPPSLITARRRDRNTNRLSIAYAFRPRLRPDSPAWISLPWNPRAFGGKIRTSLTLLVPTFALLRPLHVAFTPSPSPADRERSPTTPSPEGRLASAASALA